MKRLLFVLMLLGVFVSLNGQEIDKNNIVVTPNGLTFNNGENYIIIENGKPERETIKEILSNINTKHLSKNLKIDTLNNTIVINDFISGYTKTDKMAGSAYMLDLAYKITVDVKDNKFKVNAPVIRIASTQKNDSDGLILGNVIFNSTSQFAMEMGIKGKRDVWDSKEKKMFIFDQKDKLIEKSTKAKLEKDLSAIIDIIIDQKDNSNW